MPTPIKHKQLTDLEWVKHKLFVEKLSPGQLAKEIGASRSSVQHVIDRYLPLELAAQVTLERKRK